MTRETRSVTTPEVEKVLEDLGDVFEIDIGEGFRAAKV
jgi:hypothetical protein